MKHAKRVIAPCTVMTLLLGAPVHARTTRIPSSNGCAPAQETLPASAAARSEEVLLSRTASPGRDERTAPIDPSAPAVLIGEVRARTDRRGRLLVLVDEWTEGAPPDGVADRAFLFQSERKIEERIDERLPLAGVVFRNGSLYVTSPGGSYVIDLAVGAETESRKTVGRTVVLHDGLALQSRTTGSGRFVLDPTLLEDVTVVAEESGSIEAQSNGCDGGGRGSMSCSYSCSMSAASITKSDSCGVSCRDGYYACCGCNALYNATCACEEELFIGPRPPASGIDGY